MTTRQNTYAESLSESTTTSATFGDKVSITFTPDASSDYFLIGTARLNSSSGVADVQCRLQDDTAAATLRQYDYEVKDTSKTAGDYESVGFLAKHTSGGSPPSQTFSIEFAAESATGTAAVMDATLIAIKKASGDEYAEKTSNTITTSSTLQDDATLTFTPATTGDYLIIATAEIAELSAAAVVRAALNIDGTLYNDNYRVPKDGNNHYCWAAVVKVNLDASSHTIKIQTANTDGSATCGIVRGAVLALRLDALANNYYNESRSRGTTTSGSYVDAGATITQTPQAGDHLIIAAGGMDSNSATASVYAALNKGGSVQTESIFESFGGTASNYEHSNFHIRKETLAASSETWKTQYKSESGITCGYFDAVISIIDLEEAGGGAPSSFLWARPAHLEILTM